MVKLSPLWTAAALVLSMLSISCTTTHPGNSAIAAGTFDAYRQGMADALQEIRAGNPTIYTFGLNTPPGVDQKTGYRFKRVGTDVAATELLWRIIGHNDAIRAYGGVPPRPMAPMVP